MIKVNRKLEYALMALSYISRTERDQIVSVKEVCAETGTPFDATSYVMQKLARKKILKSVQGVHGGYVKGHDLSRLNLYQIVEAVNGPIEITKCLKVKSSCELVSSCNIQSPIHQLNGRLKSFYKDLSLQELLG